VCEATGRDGVVYSRRGYGNSDAVPEVRGAGRLQPDYMHREAWEVLPALLRALGIERPVLLGHSDGGSIALLYASRHPVTACIVMAPHVLVEDVSVRSIEAARDAYPSTIRERLGRYHADVDVAFWQWNDIWLDPAFRAFDIREDCRRIDAPVLAIQGQDDVYGTMRQIEEIAPTQGSFRMEKLAACGHSPHRDQGELTRKLVAGFLLSLP
jgi:pimeloyl-ACP methyl ester carboxylesterase